MTESKVIGKTAKKLEQRKASASLYSRPFTRKQSRKGENPTRLDIASGKSSGFQCSSWICKNPVCRAILSSDDTFCKRCSCCICHLYDDNKDPSLWLECTCESGQEDSCGLSCHIECALQHKKVGVVDLGQLMQLDGSYCCASCGKVSGILGCWKKQLIMAKEARRLDVLCYRILLSYRLLEGTSRFKEMHLMIEDAKSRLEAEVGPLNGVSTKMARGIVSRISVAVEVQKLCSLAIEKADEWLETAGSNLACKDSLPAACRFLFEEINSSSVIIVLLEPSNTSSNDIKGYKLWYCKSREEALTKEPVHVFPRAQRRILISSLQPCTEYTFRIVSYTEAGDLGHSEAKCFTKSVEILRKNPKSAAPTMQKDKNISEGCSSDENKDPETALADDSSGLKVQDLLRPAQSHSQEQNHPEVNNTINTEECCNVIEVAKCSSPDQLASASRSLDLNVGNPEGNNSTETEECCDIREVIKSNSQEHVASASHSLDLNVASVPDLNEELTQSSQDVVGRCTMEQAVEVDDDAASRGIDKNVIAKSRASDDFQIWTHRQTYKLPALDSRAESSKKRAASITEDPHDCNSSLINRSPFKTCTAIGKLDENFEYCVKIIRWLECEGYIDKEFRLKLLTWFSIRSTEQERRVVNTYIETLIDDPVSLAGQLLDSFSEVISSKRPRDVSSGKLWH